MRTHEPFPWASQILFGCLLIATALSCGSDEPSSRELLGPTIDFRGGARGTTHFAFDGDTVLCRNASIENDTCVGDEAWAAFGVSLSPEEQEALESLTSPSAYDEYRSLSDSLEPTDVCNLTSEDLLIYSNPSIYLHESLVSKSERVKNLFSFLDDVEDKCRNESRQ